MSMITKNKDNTIKNQIIEAISNMSVMDIVELITAMEEKFNISASSSVISAKETSDTPNTVEEKTEFNVVLKSIGTNKVAVIKAVRSAISLGLKEAKDLVESAPTLLKEGISKNDAESLKKSLEEAGAIVVVE